MIEMGHPELSVRRQCALLGLSRAGLYYQAIGEGPENIRLMRLLDEAYTHWPFYGVRKMTAYLRQGGEGVNPKRVRRLMRKMGIAALGPKPRTTKPVPGCKFARNSDPVRGGFRVQ